MTTWSLIYIYIPLLMVPALLILCQSIRMQIALIRVTLCRPQCLYLAGLQIATILVQYLQFMNTRLSCHICSTTLYSYCSQSGSNDDESCVQQWMEALIFQYTILVGKNTSVMIRETITHSQVNHLLLRIVEVTQVQIPNFHRAENIIYLNRR